jgi:hypothetical protein
LGGIKETLRGLWRYNDGDKLTPTTNSGGQTALPGIFPPAPPAIHPFMRTLLAIPAAVVLFAGTALAQAKPNFAGKWTIVRDTAAVQLQGVSPGGAEWGGLASEATITQDEKTLTIKRPSPTMGEFTSVFNLDGTETYSTVSVNNQSIALTMKTRWEGKKLITSTWAGIGNGQSIEFILNLHIDDKGNLVTEHVIPAMGAQMPGGTLITKYKKN